jgi:hypothetical protein
MRERSFFDGDAALHPAEHDEANQIAVARPYSSWRRSQNQRSVA